MQNESPIEVEAEDKLRWLHRLDGTREWESLDDRRRCRSCGKTFSGRQVQLVGGTRGHGPVRFVCPTANCLSTFADWLYPHESGAAAKRSACDSVGHRLSASNARGMFSYPLNSRGIWTSKIRHALQRHFGLPV